MNQPSKLPDLQRQCLYCDRGVVGTLDLGRWQRRWSEALDVYRINHGPVDESEFRDSEDGQMLTAARPECHSCPECDGTGTQLTEAGHQLLDFLNHNLTRITRNEKHIHDLQTQTEELRVGQDNLYRLVRRMAR